jgi:hypothetical protein
VFKRFLETFFRHITQILMLIVLLPGIGLAIAYVMVPRTYQSGASVWALQRYAVIGATGLESDLSSTPAETQATALTELLKTESFAISVAKHTDLATSLKLSPAVLNDPNQLNGILYGEILKVQATPVGYNLFSVSYIGPNPRTAQEVVQATIQEFGQQSVVLSVAEAQNLLASFQKQLTTAQQEAQNATTAEATYLRDHPGINTNSDPEYQSLNGQRQQADQNEQNIQGEIDTTEQALSTNGTSVSTLYTVMDPPSLPTLAQSRSSKFLTGAGIGLGVAVIASLIYLLILIGRDRAIYSVSDFQDLVDVSIIMRFPQLRKTSVARLQSGQTEN